MIWALLILLSAAIAVSFGLFGSVAFVAAAIAGAACVVARLAHQAWREWPRLTQEQQERLLAARKELRRLKAEGHFPTQ